MSTERIEDVIRHHFVTRVVEGDRPVSYSLNPIDFRDAALRTGARIVDGALGSDAPCSMVFGFNGGEARIVPDGTVKAGRFRWEDSQGNARDDYAGLRGE